MINPDEFRVDGVIARKMEAEHPDTLTSMANLASTYRNQGRWKEAEELEVQVMEIRKQVLGPEHLDSLTSMANLAYTFRSSGQGNPALLLMAECVRLRDRKLGSDHPDTRSSKSTFNEWRRMGDPRSSQSAEAPTGTEEPNPFPRNPPSGFLKTGGHRR
jgi:hypothetical protein